MSKIGLGGAVLLTFFGIYFIITAIVYGSPWGFLMYPACTVLEWNWHTLCD